MAAPSAQQQQQQQQDYFRSVSSESTTYMMVPAGGPSGTARREAPSRMWVAMVVIVVVVLQIASTTGLFVYLNMSISQVGAAAFPHTELTWTQIRLPTWSLRKTQSMLPLCCTTFILYSVQWNF